ncbi:hypothetical protein DLM75_23245 [Leptospira stimsonii]|uniref:Uncharacterized protein n=1 Tax=Leptospira stimsonii TaxID=2202203 RepID=A0A396YMJ9_9LEPT|nr:hypothetical protein DLM75_23245 [Leptospira stimsonii]
MEYVFSGYKFYALAFVFLNDSSFLSKKRFESAEIVQRSTKKVSFLLLALLDSFDSLFQLET